MSRNWFATSLAALSGVAIGLLVGIAMRGSGQPSIVSANPPEPVPVARPASATPAADHSDSASLDQLLSAAYGPNSQFARFASNLQVTGSWSPETAFYLVGNTRIRQEAKGLSIHDPKSRVYVGSASVAFDKLQGTPTVTIDLDLAKLYLLSDKRLPAMESALGAVATAAGVTDSEKRRLAGVTSLIPACTPRAAPNAIATVAMRLPTAKRERFAQRLVILAAALEKHDFEVLHHEDNSRPAVSFELSERVVASLGFGDWKDGASQPPSVWTVTICPNDPYSRPEAWARITESELDALVK
jgi:hypothetical protein